MIGVGLRSKHLEMDIRKEYLELERLEYTFVDCHADGQISCSQYAICIGIVVNIHVVL